MHMIDIHNRAELFALFHQIPATREPLFGAMTPQHMVEHLTRTVRFSNGREPQPHYYSPEKEQRFKTYLLGNDAPMVVGFRSPVLPPEGLPDLLHSDLAEAIRQLEEELEEFDRFFRKNPGATPVNPSLGELTYGEWVRFHEKHFVHHLGQFGLIA